jgi:hypothetical protein
MNTFVAILVPYSRSLPAVINNLVDDDIPFGEGAELIVDIPIDPQGLHDVYINDIILLTVDIPGTDNVARGQSASLLAINATTEPNHPEEPIPREPKNLSPGRAWTHVTSCLQKRA